MAPESAPRRWTEHEERGDAGRSPRLNLNQSVVMEEDGEDERNGHSRSREMSGVGNGAYEGRMDYEDDCGGGHRGRRKEIDRYERRNRGPVVDTGLDLNVGNASPPQLSSVKRSPKLNRLPSPSPLPPPPPLRRGRSPTPRGRSVSPPVATTRSRKSITPPYNERKSAPFVPKRGSLTPPSAVGRRESGSPPPATRRRSITPPYVPRPAARKRSVSPPSGPPSRSRTSATPPLVTTRRRSNTPPHISGGIGRKPEAAPVAPGKRRPGTPPHLLARGRSISPGRHPSPSQRGRSTTPVRREPLSPPLNRARSPRAARRRSPGRRSPTPLRRRPSPDETVFKNRDHRPSRSPVRALSADLASRRRDYRPSRSPVRLHRERSRTRTPPQRRSPLSRGTRSPPPPRRPLRRSPRRERTPIRGYSPRRRASPDRSRGTRRGSPGRRPWSPPQNRSNGVGKPGNNLFIAGFNFITTERDLERKFSRYGRVMDVRIVRDKRSGESRGFGFLTLERDEDADAAIKSLDQTEWNGRIVLVEKAKTPTRF